MLLPCCPGTPGALEKFRERLIERHGILAISVLRFYLGTGDIVRERLIKAISKMEIKLDKPELNQVNSDENVCST